MQLACLTDVGREREHNEDNVLVLQHRLLRGDRQLGFGLVMVSDGMGGAAAGEVASRLTIQTISERAYRDVLRAHLNPDQTYLNAEKLLIAAVEEANEVVCTAARDTPGQYGMGATVTAALITGGFGFVAQVGDSRCYRLHDSELKQLTQDHSLVAELVRTGRITREQARNHPRKNVITRAVGSRPEVQVDTYRTKLEPGDLLILGSDGLFGMVEEEELRTALLLGLKRRSGLEAMCRELVRMANEAGGEDNISVALMLAEAKDVTAGDSDAISLVPDATLSWDEAVDLELDDSSFERVDGDDEAPSLGRR